MHAGLIALVRSDPSLVDGPSCIRASGAGPGLVAKWFTPRYLESPKMILGRLFGTGSRGIAIDLGTANRVVYVQGVGIVFNEPSVVAMEWLDGKRRVRAVGSDAKLMMGKTPDYIKTI